MGEIALQVRSIQFEDMVVVVEEVQRTIGSGQLELHLHFLEFFGRGLKRWDRSLLGRDS